MTHQSNHSRHATHPIIAKWCIWSIENQTWLAGRLRIYIWGATAVVAFFTYVGIIDLETGLWSVFLSGVAICMVIWLLIRQRKIWLLHIEEPEQRQQALTAMVNYLHSINHNIPTHPYGHPIPEGGSKVQADCTHSKVTMGEKHLLQ